MGQKITLRELSINDHIVSKLCKGGQRPGKALPGDNKRCFVRLSGNNSSMDYWKKMSVHIYLTASTTPYLLLYRASRSESEPHLHDRAMAGEEKTVGQFLADGQEYMSKTGLDDYLQTLLQQIVQTRSPDSASQIEVLTRCSCVLA